MFNHWALIGVNITPSFLSCYIFQTLKNALLAAGSCWLPSTWRWLLSLYTQVPYKIRQLLFWRSRLRWTVWINDCVELEFLYFIQFNVLMNILGVFSNSFLWVILFSGKEQNYPLGVWVDALEDCEIRSSRNRFDLGFTWEKCYVKSFVNLM